MWVRNPYTRLLSGFLEKLSGGKWHHRNVVAHGGPYESTPEGFESFVERLVYMRDHGIAVNNHFAPLAERCGIDSGMQYDLYLRVEEIDMWYAEVVDFLGLREAVKSGWGIAEVSGLAA